MFIIISLLLFIDLLYSCHYDDDSNDDDDDDDDLCSINYQWRGKHLKGSVSCEVEISLFYDNKKKRFVLEAKRIKVRQEQLVSYSDDLSYDNHDDDDDDDDDEYYEDTNADDKNDYNNRSDHQLYKYDD